MPRARCQRHTDAGHFAPFQAGTGPLGGPGLDPAFDPAGFDRVAWQAAAWPRWRDFLALVASTSSQMLCSIITGTVTAPSDAAFSGWPNGDSASTV